MPEGERGNDFLVGAQESKEIIESDEREKEIDKIFTDLKNLEEVEQRVLHYLSQKKAASIPLLLERALFIDRIKISEDPDRIRTGLKTEQENLLPEVVAESVITAINKGVVTPKDLFEELPQLLELNEEKSLYGMDKIFAGAGRHPEGHDQLSEYFWQTVASFVQNGTVENWEIFARTLSNLPEEFFISFLLKKGIPEKLLQWLEVNYNRATDIDLDWVFLRLIKNAKDRNQKKKFLSTFIIKTVQVNPQGFLSDEVKEVVDEALCRSAFEQAIQDFPNKNFATHEDFNIIGFHLFADFQALEMFPIGPTNPYEKTVVTKLASPGAKIDIMRSVDLHQLVPDPQAWISIYPPAAAREVYTWARSAFGTKMSSLESIVEKRVGVKKITEDYFDYLPDEIIDAVLEMVRNQPTKNQQALKELCEKYGITDEEAVLRYAKRTPADVRLGNETGDCTAPGAINYKNSLSWHVNPAYQILLMKSGRRMMGKMNMALGSVAQHRAILIDALEFNPQAVEGKPYHEKAKVLYGKALAFAKDLAKKEESRLYALVRSNSQGANTILQSEGQVLASEDGIRTLPREKEKVFTVSLAIPRVTAEFIQQHQGKVWYQMFEESVEKIESIKKGPADKIDDRLSLLERDVINPAQIARKEVAEAMEQRDFEMAAKLILQDPNSAAKASDFFGIPPSYGTVSPKLLAEKMRKLYKSTGISVEQLENSFLLKAHSFTRLV